MTRHALVVLLGSLSVRPSNVARSKIDCVHSSSGVSYSGGEVGLST